MLKRMRGERGFTLVELLVVIAILAILIAIVVPNLAGITGGARETAADTELNIVQSAMDTLMTENDAVTVTAQAAPGVQVGPYTSVTYWQFDGDSGTDTLRLRATSTGYYSWDTSGKVTQESY